MSKEFVEVLWQIIRMRFNSLAGVAIIHMPSGENDTDWRCVRREAVEVEMSKFRLLRAVDRKKRVRLP